VEEGAAYGRRVVTWVVQDGGAQRVPRLRELMDFAGYTRVGNDASCNDPVDFFRTVQRMIDLDRNKEPANEGVLCPRAPAHCSVSALLYTLPGT